MSAAQTTSAFAADAPRYGSEPVDAYYKLNEPGVAGVVTLINPGGNSGTVTFGSSGGSIAVTPVVGGVNLDVVGGGGGVTAIVAGGNSSTGAVPLTSADSSVLFTNTGGAGTLGSISMKSVIPTTRTLYAPAPDNFIVAGTGASPVSTLIMGIDGLTVGKSYLLTVNSVFYISPDFATPSAGQFITAWLYTGAPPQYAAPTALGENTVGKFFNVSPIAVATKLLADAADGGITITSFGQTLAGVVVAQSTSLGIFTGVGAITSAAGTVRFNPSNVRDTFMQVTQLD